MDNREKLEKYGLYDSRFEHDSCGVGFVCNVKGNRTNQCIRQALEVLTRLSHRGATGADPKTGDGAGILMQAPHDFFLKVAAQNKISLPASGHYASGLIFLPINSREREFCKDLFARIIKEENQQLLGWRTVPVDDSDIGKTARDTKPVIEQVFIAKSKDVRAGIDFERALYFIRRKIEKEVTCSCLEQKSFFILLIYLL